MVTADTIEIRGESKLSFPTLPRTCTNFEIISLNFSDRIFDNLHAEAFGPPFSVYEGYKKLLLIDNPLPDSSEVISGVIQIVHYNYTYQDYTFEEVLEIVEKTKYTLIARNVGIIQRKYINDKGVVANYQLMDWEVYQ
jgi:hypothetical protein